MAHQFVGHINHLRLLQLWTGRQEMRHRRRAGILLYLQDREQRRRRQRRRESWVVSWLTQEQKLAHGAYHQLMHHLEQHHVRGFIRFLRFEPAMFREMEQRLSGHIQMQDTAFRDSISPGERLAITLRYLATGETFRSLAFHFRVAHNTISKIIKQVCEAIITEYGPEVMPEEISVEDWKDIADEFQTYWNFPNVMGAIDGKHIPIVCPKNAGSAYFNYKKFHSIILIAVVDAKYRFRCVSVGANGACSDLQVFNATNMKKKIDRQEFEWPEPTTLPNDDEPLPYFFLADDAFALDQWLMKPYSRHNMSVEDRIFNYRLSRARRVVENAFGILVKRFRCLLKTLEVSPDQATRITMACVLLHNLMRIRYPTMQNPYGDRFDRYGRLIRGGWRDRPQLIGGPNLPGGNYGTRLARLQRDYLRDYFNSRRGSVPWQHKMV